MSTLYEDITNASKALSVFLSLYLISFFWIWLEECRHNNMIEELFSKWRSSDYFDEVERMEKLIEEIVEESPYLRGYHAYWEGLESNEVSALQYQGWCDARDEVEKGTSPEISER